MPQNGIFNSALNATRLARRARQSGQTLIFILIVLVVLVFVMLAIYDTHHVITQRIRAQNGVDSAALTGAKYQGEFLNAIGELNLMKATTLIYFDVPPGVNGNASAQNIVDAMTEMQRRLDFVGPMLGVLQAQQAAKLNKIRERPELAVRIHRRASLLRQMANMGALSQAGYPGWAYDYADMLDALADEGLAAEFVNAQFANGSLHFSNPLASQYLGQQAFYQAIAARDWCFLEDLLLNQNYTDYTFWGSVAVNLPPMRGSEFLNLGITFQTNTWLGGSNGVRGALSDPEIQELRSVMLEMGEERGIPDNQLPSGFTIDRQGLDHWLLRYHPQNNLPFPLADPSWPQRGVVNPLTWAVFDQNRWRDFGQDVDAPPPSEVLVADIRPEYNYSGADASARVAIEPNITLSLRPRSDFSAQQAPPTTDWMPGQHRADIDRDLRELQELSYQETVVSTAAAKPFGKLTVNGRAERPDAYRVVLPSFDTVRLIPMVYASGGNGFEDGDWLEHKFFHLPIYLSLGPDFLAFSCFYCRQLRVWEDPAFRQSGVDWLQTHDCPPPPTIPPWHGGHGGGGGGGVIPQPRPGGVKIAH